MSKDQRMLRYNFQAGSGWNVGSAEVKGVQPIAVQASSPEEQAGEQTSEQTGETAPVEEEVQP